MYISRSSDTIKTYTSIQRPDCCVLGHVHIYLSPTDKDESRLGRPYDPKKSICKLYGEAILSGMGISQDSPGLAIQSSSQGMWKEKKLKVEKTMEMSMIFKCLELSDLVRRADEK